MTANGANGQQHTMAPAETMTNNNKAHSNRSSFSSAQTIIEPEQQQEELSQELQTIDHERRLRLIEVNRSQLRIIQDPVPSHSPSELSIQSQPGLPKSSIKIHLLLSPTNQKYSIDLNPPSDVYHLKLDLFQNWPSDWSRKGNPCPNQFSQIRLIYMGRVLNDQDLLNSLGGSQELTIHLVIKPDDQRIEEEPKEVPLLNGFFKTYCCCFSGPTS